jgi:hypothetical protein
MTRMNKIRRGRKLAFALVLGTLVGACSTTTGKGSENGGITLPLLSAWYDGKKVYYVTTDVSDRKVAQIMGANLTPRLKDGLPSYPKAPTQTTLLERVYAFTNSPQDKVFSSAPAPIGPASADRHYSPIWLAVNVTWAPSATPKTLTSEEDILAEEEAHSLTLERTEILLNCPIVGSETGGFLPNTSRHPL